MMDRVYGTLYGNCIGDAIGLLTEFMTKDEAKTYYGKKGGLEYEHKVPDFHRSRWANGDWTDDTDQMILMMQSILDKKGEVDPVDYGQKVINWARHGFEELGDFAGMGLGATTHHVLKHKLFKTDPHKAAEDIWTQSGKFVAPNGAVMRTSVLGIYQFEDRDKVINNTRNLCRVTHADPRCQASCVAVTTAIAMMLQGQHFNGDTFDINKITEEAYKEAKKFIPKDVEHYKEYTKELKVHMFCTNIKDLKLDEHKKIGYTYKTLGAGFWALKQKNFREALTAIVMEAGDADTNGAVAGALLGCKLGQHALPPTWYNELVNKDWLDKIIEPFLVLVFPGSPSVELKNAGVAGKTNPNAKESESQSTTETCDDAGQESQAPPNEDTQTPTEDGLSSQAEQGEAQCPEDAQTTPPPEETKEAAAGKKQTTTGGAKTASNTDTGEAQTGNAKEPANL